MTKQGLKKWAIYKMQPRFSKTCPIEGERTVLDSLCKIEHATIIIYIEVLVLLYTFLCNTNLHFSFYSYIHNLNHLQLHHLF